MMNAKKLMKVKQFQREYEKLYNERLEIDFIAMKGIEVTEVDKIDVSLIDREKVDLGKLLNECLTKYGADLEKIKERRKRLQVGAYTKERAAVREYCKIVVHLKGNINEAARLINRDRSVIYHYAGMR